MMNIYDCFMYFDEDLLLDLRLNTLNKYVKKFIITEATYTHNGNKKKLKFDMKLNIDKTIVGDKKVFVIAEIGNNHNGDFNRAKMMIDKVVEMGADCVKFQMRQIKELYRSKSLEKTGEDLGTEYIIDLLKKFELSIEQQNDLSNYCKSKGILYMCTPWDIKSVEILETFKVPAYKVASADLTNLPLIDRLVTTKKPLILSTGMSTESEIQVTVDFLDKRQANYVLLHRNSTYPAPFHDINLNWIKRLQEIHPLVGYSGHERGISVTLAAVAMGSKIIERHFTFDRNMEGPDHKASLECKDLNKFVKNLCDIKFSLGKKRNFISKKETDTKKIAKKAIYFSKKLDKNHKIKKNDLIALRPRLNGVSPMEYKKIIGKRLKDPVKAQTIFNKNKIR